MTIYITAKKVEIFKDGQTIKLAPGLEYVLIGPFERQEHEDETCTTRCYAHVNCYNFKATLGNDAPHLL